MAKKRFVVSVLVPLAFILAACGRQDANPARDVQPEAVLQGGQTVAQEPSPVPTPQPSPTQPTTSPIFDTQSSDAGRVVIDVTPLSLSDDEWSFEVALNTHSVNLGFDMTEVSGLRCDRGQEHTPVAWDGSGPGGHHRSGVLKFAALDHPTSFVEIVIRDVAGEPERLFHWDVPAGGSSLGGSAVQLAARPPALAVGKQP